MIALARRSAASLASRGFHTSQSLHRGVNEVVRKKVKLVVLPNGALKPHLAKIQKHEKRAEFLRAKFAEIENQPVVHWKPPSLQSWVFNLEGEPVGIVPLNSHVWGSEIRGDVVHRVVRWQRAGWRQGTHQAKTRNEVSGGGRKPRPQKGSGQARVGSIRSPLMRGGGAVHGPRHRDHSFKLPTKVVQMGMRSAFAAKFQEGNLFVIKDMWLDTHKTADLLALLKRAWRPLLHSRVAIVHTEAELDPNFALAARNIWNLDFFTPETANVYEIVKRHHLIITESALKAAEARLTSLQGQDRGIKFAVDRPPVKLAEALPLRFGRFKRKQQTHMRLVKEKATRQELHAKVRNFQQQQNA